MAQLVVFLIDDASESRLRNGVEYSQTSPLLSHPVEALVEHRDAEWTWPSEGTAVPF